MTARNRTSTTTGPKGTWRRFGQSSGGGLILRGRSNIADHTGPGDCQNLWIDHIDTSGGRLNSKYDPGYWGSYWQQYVVDILDDPVSAFPHWDSSLEGHRTVASFATEAVSRTNPSKPYVDIPVALFELGDILTLIKNTGDSIIQKLGKNNLRLQFGLLPLIGDINKLTLFQDALAQRMKVLDKLRSTNGLRRTMTLGTYVGNAVVWKTMQSVGGYYALNFTQQTTRKVRAHVRWLPDVNYASMSLTERQRLAVKALLGNTLDISTVWEAMPWSWLIDWGFNVGQFFASHRNIVPAMLSGVTVMTETITTYQSPSWESDTVTLEGVSVKAIRKLRQVGNVALAAHFPFLTGRQMGILASLAVTR